MNKIIYLLKKLGIYRSSSYGVKGDASKLNEMNAKDGGMIQGQKEIDEEYEKKTGKKIPEGAEKGKVKIIFWIFVVLGFFFLLAFWGGGFSWGSFIILIVWLAFLFCLWRGEKSWTASFVKVLVIGLSLVVLSLFFVDSSDKSEKKVSPKEDSQVSNIEEEMCDDSNSQNADFSNIEKVIVSKNPCKVPWILAKEYERYNLKTKNGTILKVIVWNNYVNNVQAGESYTIRVLDVEDTAGVPSKKEEKAGVAIVRWVKNKASLAAAKKEVKDVVEELEY